MHSIDAVPAGSRATLVKRSVVIKNTGPSVLDFRLFTLNAFRTHPSTVSGYEDQKIRAVSQEATLLSGEDIKYTFYMNIPDVAFCLSYEKNPGETILYAPIPYSISGGLRNRTLLLE